MKDLLSRRNLI